MAGLSCQETYKVTDKSDNDALSLEVILLTHERLELLAHFCLKIQFFKGLLSYVEWESVAIIKEKRVWVILRDCVKKGI